MLILAFLVPAAVILAVLAGIYLQRDTVREVRRCLEAKRVETLFLPAPDKRTRGNVQTRKRR